MKKCENPCKTFQVGNVNYASKFAKSASGSMQTQSSQKTYRVSVKPKKNWALVKLAQRDQNGKERRLKNGGKITLKESTSAGAFFVLHSGHASITATFLNLKTGETQQLNFNVNSSYVQY